MKVFLLDLWLDLREKRLAPVALGLLAAIVAVPFVLAKGEPEPPPPPPTAAADRDSALPQVATVEGEFDSRLDTFDPRDPFDPVAAAVVPQGAEGGTGGGDAGGDSGGGDDTPTGGGDTPTGGGDTPTGGGPTGGGETGGDTGGDEPTERRRTVFFTYTVDVTFGEFGRERRRNGVRRLELLPGQRNPVVAFLGVTTNARTAVFLVSRGFEATGDGVCRPTREQCTFLYLRRGEDRNTAVLTGEDGRVFRLTLRDINRVVLGAGADDENTARGRRRPAFTGSMRGAPPGEPEHGPGSRLRGPALADDGRG